MGSYGDDFVYFIRRSDGEGPFKIGHSEHPEGRLASLMCWSPYPLTIVATIPGHRRLEQRFHAKFADAHSHGEWFRPTPELVWTAHLVARGAFDIETLPAPLHRLKGVPRPRSPASAARYNAWIKIRRLKRAGAEVPDGIWAEISSSTYKISTSDLQARADRAEAYLSTIQRAA